MATTQDLTIDQGTSVKINYTVKQLTNPDLPYNASTNPYIPIDLTNSNIRMMVRPTIDSSVVTLNLTNQNGKFTVTDAGNGLFNLQLLPTDTSNISIKGDTTDFVYDLEIEDVSGVVTRAFQGTFTLSKEVTR